MKDIMAVIEEVKDSVVEAMGKKPPRPEPRDPQTCSHWLGIHGDGSPVIDDYPFCPWCRKRMDPVKAPKEAR